MNVLNRDVVAYEIERRLRDADFHRRVHWGRESARRARRSRRLERL